MVRIFFFLYHVNQILRQPRRYFRGCGLDGTSHIQWCTHNRCVRSNVMYTQVGWWHVCARALMCVCICVCECDPSRSRAIIIVVVVDRMAPVAEGPRDLVTRKMRTSPAAHIYTHMLHVQRTRHTAAANQCITIRINNPTHRYECSVCSSMNRQYSNAHALWYITAVDRTFDELWAVQWKNSLDKSTIFHLKTLFSLHENNANDNL